jgi:hypothetical protein
MRDVIVFVEQLGSLKTGHRVLQVAFDNHFRYREAGVPACTASLRYYVHRRT